MRPECVGEGGEEFRLFMPVTMLHRALIRWHAFWAANPRLEWVVFLVNVIFSSTFLTIFCILLAINKDLRRVFFLFLTWVIWLVASLLLLFLRLFIGAYHFSRITLDLFFFLVMKMLSKAFCAFQCAHNTFRNDLQERLLAELDEAESFDHWLETARQLDDLNGATEWRETDQSPLYEWEALKAHVERLRTARLNGDTGDLMFLLRLCCSRDFCGVSNPALFSFALTGTKFLVEDFAAEVCAALRFICFGHEEDREGSERNFEDIEGAGVDIGTTTAAVSRHRLSLFKGGDTELEDVTNILSSQLANHCRLDNQVNPSSPVVLPLSGFTVGLRPCSRREALSEAVAPRNQYGGGSPHSQGPNSALPSRSSDCLGQPPRANSMAKTQRIVPLSVPDAAAYSRVLPRRLSAPCGVMRLESGGSRIDKDADDVSFFSAAVGDVRLVESSSRFVCDKAIQTDLKLSEAALPISSPYSVFNAAAAASVASPSNTFLSSAAPRFVVAPCGGVGIVVGAEAVEKPCHHLHTCTLPLIKDPPLPFSESDSLKNETTSSGNTSSSGGKISASVSDGSGGSLLPLSEENHLLPASSATSSCPPGPLGVEAWRLGGAYENGGLKSACAYCQQTEFIGDGPRSASEYQPASFNATQGDAATEAAASLVLRGHSNATCCNSTHSCVNDKLNQNPVSSKLGYSQRGGPDFLSERTGPGHSAYNQDGSTRSSAMQDDKSLAGRDFQLSQDLPQGYLGGFPHTAAEVGHDPTHSTSPFNVDAKVAPLAFPSSNGLGPPSDLSSCAAQSIRRASSPTQLPGAAKPPSDPSDPASEMRECRSAEVLESAVVGAKPAAVAAQNSLLAGLDSTMKREATHISPADITLPIRPEPMVVSAEEALKCLATLRLSLGRTALCLSGGGSLAMYHMGVVKGLLDIHCLPRVISGTSGGSIVAAQLAIHDDEEMINDIIRPDIVNCKGKRWFPPVTRQIRRFFVKGQMMDGDEFTETCKAYYGAYTFREAFAKTGRLVSIVVTPASRSGGEALILNCINSPDVFLWSAVASSCALPGLLPPLELMAKSGEGKTVPFCPSGLRWMDGSLSQDIPIKELACLFNVKQFIVSQVNPHHAPFVDTHSPGSRWMRSLENWLTLDIKNRYAKLAKFNMIPKIFGQDISSFWLLQVYEGHVTITPRASLIDWYRIINQPTLEDMQDFIAKGESRTWPHSPRIVQLMKIEQTLRHCWSHLTLSVEAGCKTIPIQSASAIHASNNGGSGGSCVAGNSNNGVTLTNNNSNHEKNLFSSHPATDLQTALPSRSSDVGLHDSTLQRPSVSHLNSIAGRRAGTKSRYSHTSGQGSKEKGRDSMSSGSNESHSNEKCPEQASAEAAGRSPKSSVNYFSSLLHSNESSLNCRRARRSRLSSDAQRVINGECEPEDEEHTAEFIGDQGRSRAENDAGEYDSYDDEDEEVNWRRRRKGPSVRRRTKALQRTQSE